MNTERMQLMLTMLKEVQAGTWKPGVVPEIRGDVDTSAVAFNLEVWAGIVNSEGNHCGFAACAVGHACLDPRFNALGLYLDGQLTAPRYSECSADHRWDSWSNVKEFFDIPARMARWLFNSISYRGVKEDWRHVRVEEVIARVEQALAEQAAADGNLLKELGQ